MTGVVTGVILKYIQFHEASRQLHGRGGNRGDAKIISNSMKLLCNFMAGMVTGVMLK